MKKLASATDPLWYKDAVIYELHVRAFADSNGDGIGDFPGLLSRLDYLQELGVTCIWLLPFFPSPLRDDGYDISNYVDVNPSYGTLRDFRLFLDEAHRRDMQVMIELVVNHTSDQHPWFKAARMASPGSPERNMYVWSTTDQLYKDARIIFTDTEKSNWTWDDTAKAFYWHRFFSHQPDLNYDSPLVMEQVLKAMRFWLDMGVDALRMDAIPYLVERDGTSCENLPETHVAIKQIRAAIDAEYSNRLILAEANQWPADVRPYFGDGDECHMAFHFPLMPRIYMALRQEDRLPITDIMAQTPSIPDGCQWALFLRNHDELTLEMVTDDERDYMYLAYSADPRMRVNVGIRRRLAPLVDNNRRRIELLNSLLLSFPGTPVLYYGDEIGMGDNIYLGDRNGVRTPMQWNSDRNAGFSRCDPARLYFPVVMDPIYGYQVINVEAQQSDPSSLLHWTRNMIALRKLFQVFGRGSLRFLNPANRKILAYLRELDSGDGLRETVLCVANLSRFAQPVALDLAEFAGAEPVEMLGYVPFPIVTDAPYSLSLAPYSFLWLELQPASLRPEPAAAPVAVAAEEVPESEAAAMDLEARGWVALTEGHGLAFFGQALESWLPRQRWFGAKARKIRTTRIVDWVELTAKSDPHREGEPRRNGARDNDPRESLSPAILFVEIDYTDGPRELYQIPLMVSTGAAADEVSANAPLSTVSTLPMAAGPAVLHDATASETTRQRLLDLIQENATVEMSHAGASPLQAHAAIEAPASVTTEVEENTDAQSASDAGLPVVPAPITAQPGETAASPRAETATASTSAGQQSAPRESPTAGTAREPARRLEARPSTAFSAARGTGRLASRTGSAEQSNTSILYGDRLILKLYRRLEQGQNPDVEIGRFLTEAGFPRVAPFLGEIAIVAPGAPKTTTAMLQGFVANSGDGWKWFLGEIGKFFQTVQGLPAPPETTIASFVTEQKRNEQSELFAGRWMEAAALLGRRTAEMHLALATPAIDPAFAPEPMTSSDLGREARRIAAEITSTLETLKAKLAGLKDATADQAALLLSRRLELFARVDAIAELPPSGLRIRIHGDYHLGQTLCTAANDAAGASDFVMLDFEGEPARSLAERRQKQSPLKDVAGMMRSLSYAAFAGMDEFSNANPEAIEEEHAAAWAIWWQNTASGEFLRSYCETAAANVELLPQSREAEAMLRVYLLEKALYELLYELNNRPAWLRIPLSGILNL